ncbi:zinc ribbon domain-containing protein [Nitrospina watsonii]|uniref:Zf-RING_7 domain-containing protein n=1 Tax=Nitrospina watsonii TaxID=1323948 RepID=A0ABN8VYN4_9BACT|nr:C4-type zinc ribbon domain-containing protein [Nitrospina watsonii]CAI2718874.1 zf-RING_7 domain-containing protein [Nitrospina watsonii]
MNPQLQKMVTVQQLDNEITEVQSLVDLIPGQIQAGEKELEGKKGDLNTVQQKMESLKKQRKQFEQDVQAEHDRIAKTKGKLPTVKTNKEYSAILAEIETLKNKIDGIEEKELDVMEQLEELEKTVPALEQQFNGERQKFEEYKKKKEEELRRTQEELTGLQSKRQGLIDAVDPKMAVLYEKLCKARGVAVVPVEGEICKGCFQQIQPQVALEVRTSPDKIHQCQFCDRFLYSIPKPEEETETQTAVPK